jgi:anti-anti-sigma factor
MPRVSRVLPPAAVPSQGFMPFTCTSTSSGGDGVWIHTAGELDIGSSPRLAQTLAEAQQTARLVILDLRELTFIDSSGVHVILDAARAAQRCGASLIVTRGRALVERMFNLIDASEELVIVDLDPAEPPVQALLHGARAQARPRTPSVRASKPRNSKLSLTARSRGGLEL